MGTDKFVASVVESLHGLRIAKHRVAVLVGPTCLSREDLVEKIAGATDATYLDTLQDIMRKIGHEALGAYGPIDFCGQLVRLSDDAGTTLCIDDVDPLLVTFGIERAEQFFALASNAIPRYPVLLVSALGDLLARSGFDSHRIFTPAK